VNTEKEIRQDLMVKLM